MARKGRGRRKWQKALRREYVRDRGRHDRIWDGATSPGRVVMRNMLRTGFDGCLRELRRSMNTRMWGMTEAERVQTDWIPTPAVKGRMARRG